MIRIGIAGIGFMGWMHYLAYRRCDETELAAICTRSQKKLAGDWRDIQGNFGPPGEQVDTSALATYAQLDDLLADDTIDMVDLCLPPHLHADAAVAAVERGKHVFCEKPMALTTDACQRMVAAARANDRQLFIGHVLPMFTEYAQVLRWIEDGTYGSVRGGSFKRVISDPLWLEGFYDPQRVGGPLIDLHVHDAHLIRLLFGRPTEVVSQGRMRGAVVEYCHTLFRFDDPQLVVHAVSGIIPQQGRSFTHGFEIHTADATLLFESAVIDGAARTLMPLTALAGEGRVEQPDLVEGDAVDPFVAEVREVARCTAANRPSRILDGDLARDAVVLCHCQTESVQTGKAVAVPA
jgi:predicted dehydrogenase